MPASLHDAYGVPDHWFAIDARRSVLALASDWALMAACFVIAIRFAHPLVSLIAAVVIGRTQLALAVMMHESAHGLLFKSRRANDWAGQFFAAGPLMVSLYVYRYGHLKHHRAPMAPDDPVANLFNIADYPLPRRTLCLRLLQDLTGVGYCMSVRDVLRGRHRAMFSAARTSRGETMLVLASMVVTQGALIGGLWALGHPELYLWLWIVPSLTFLQLFGRLRAITEHAGYGPSADQSLNARTIVRANWQTFFCGPHNIHYHIEHHVQARLPFHRLPAMHTLLRARGTLPPGNLYRGYAQVLRDVTT